MIFPLPRPVRPGSRLAVIAPAGPFDEALFHSGATWLSTRYEVLHRVDIVSQSGYLAGSDERRLSEILDAITDPSIDAIICVRGGFGTARILPGISREQVRAANKLLVGFSDITALHALWAEAGVRSIHGPMVAALGKASETVRRHWIDTLEDPGKERWWELSPVNTRGESQGRLIGGNLTVLSSLLGTPYAPDLSGCILFIEDVGERPYRIDRTLTAMKQAGFFNELAGLVIGAFTDGAPGPDGVSIEEVLSEHFGEAPFPVLSGFSAGHIDDNIPLPFGVEARICGSILETIPAEISSLT